MDGPTAGVKQLRDVMQLCYSWLRRVEGHSSTIRRSLLLISNTSTRQETLQDNVALCIVECAARKAVIEQELRAFVVEAARQGGFTSSSAQGRLM
jgi:hypothetical protein